MVRLIAFWTLLGLGVWSLNRAYPGVLDAAGNRRELVVFLAFLGLFASSLVVGFKGRFGAVVRMAVVWALIFAGLVGAYAWRGEAGFAARRTFAYFSPSEPVLSGEREVTVRVGADGHFRVWAEINGERVQFVVDTGASTIALTVEDARRVGIDLARLDYDQPVITANGQALTAGLDLDAVSIGPIRLDDVPTRVMQAGALDRSLLGMSFLSRLASVELRGSKLVLRQ
ncbi:MAG: TIGR02281 family clan AA aspartic protease [Geminicoccaceae bacterium]|nr:TIGR02281 family clan AA aspartic protease [Geminicoccaceae bacterium]